MNVFKFRNAAATIALAALPSAVWANDEAPAATAEESAEIVVYGRAIEQIGVASSASQGTIGYKDFESRPVSRVGELAENVPGLIATQHSGTGKANQYFLRGFNLDHGTDLAGFVDGAPVNMRSHGHGQGYLDLNFLIPELAERVDYQKGPYSVDNGDFSAAGSISFSTKSALARPLAEITIGSFGYRRALLAGSGKLGDGTILAALEGTITNGPWVLDEDLQKFNGLLKYSEGDEKNGWSIGLSGYQSRWTATDQIPERAIASGRVSRFGNIDDSLNNRSSRFSLNFLRKTDDSKIAVYALTSRLLLTSNFTYFLDDPINGDQFQQRDQRQVYGGSAQQSFAVTTTVKARAGLEGRLDDIGKVGLYRSTRGVQRSVVREDSVDEYSAAAFVEVEWALAPRLRAIAGLRGDVIGYNVDAGLAANSGKGSDAILAPKFALAWRPVDAVELYANYGESYHSNDVRGATITVDPVSGDAAGRVPVIARARGTEIGARIETGKFTASAVGYYLELGSELVFVGDAGTTEPSDASRRFGTEFALFWRPLGWLTADATAAFTNARFRGVPAGFRRIPGSVNEVLAGGVQAEFGRGLSASARVRHFGAAPLIEDGSVTSDPTTIVNFGGYYTRGRFRLGIDLLNAFDAKDADISYFYASRLPGEPAEGIEDRHIHPVEPRQLRVSLRARF